MNTAPELDPVAALKAEADAQVQAEKIGRLYAEAWQYKRERDKAVRALNVFLYTPATRDWLLANDPQAFKQAAGAIPLHLADCGRDGIDAELVRQANRLACSP